MPVLSGLLSWLKKLPGVGLILAGVTFVAVKALGNEVLAGVPLFVMLAWVAAAYWIGSLLDSLIYDKLFGPRVWRPLKKVPGVLTLAKARGEAAVCLFSRPGYEIVSYQDAVDRGNVGPKKSLYGRCKFLVAGTSEWAKNIQWIHDQSKACRTLFVLAASVLVLIVVVPLLSGSAGALLFDLRLNAGVFGDAFFYAVVAGTSLPGYLGLRWLHQLRLYRYVVSHLIFLEATTDGRRIHVPVIDQFKDWS